MPFDPNPADPPLLPIAWRRPHTLRQVIDAIRPAAPTRMFVACDGPNTERPGEAEKVAATRADGCVPHPAISPHCTALLEPERGIHPVFVLRW
jgi:hypothetical protein